ncbi:MAG: zinc ribbon domain-containing protein [Acidimicrobiia bacterium]|nr:zinc ribbon domain-containing protein [Acidimicrobiia bacterium]MBP8179715.1 zinc ribbon domain-containing protein [Acidimicrobiia bacterium]
MPLYEFRCRTCGATFEERRTMSEANAVAVCPDGHEDCVRLLSVFSSTGGASAPTPAPARSRARPSGGGCGSGCGCAH